MGGYGSGRQGRLPTIEDGLKLDLRSLRRQGVIKDNVALGNSTLQWTYSYSGEDIATVGLSYSTDSADRWLRLQYKVTSYDGEVTRVDDKIRLERFPQPFGGHRLYFICPFTGVRCHCLYKPSGATRFRSRRGFGVRLQYRSQEQDQPSRVVEMGRRAAAKIMRAGTRAWREQHQHWDFPPKPPLDALDRRCNLPRFDLARVANSRKTQSE